MLMTTNEPGGAALGQNENSFDKKVCGMYQAATNKIHWSIQAWPMSLHSPLNRLRQVALTQELPVFSSYWLTKVKSG